MRLLTIFVFCVLTSGVEGGWDIFGIGSFFDSSRSSIERLTSIVEVESKACRQILERAAEEVVKLAYRLEGRVDETLNKVDELIERTGYRMDNLADIVIILCMVFMFVVISSLCDNRQFIFIYYSLQFIRVVSLITAMMLVVRLICELVLRVHMSTASTIKYCIIAPVVFVLVMVVLYVVHKPLKLVGFVLIFILKGPRLIIYCTVDGPCRWTYGAYTHGPEMKTKKGFILSIALPWLTLSIWIAVFHLCAGDVGDEHSEHFAIRMGLFIAYLFFLVCANHLRRFYHRPEPQAHLRNLYNQKDDHVHLSGQVSERRPIKRNVKYRR